MEKFESLADFLGVQDPVQPERTVTPPPSRTMTVKAFCKEILASPQYRESILRRILMDELPPGIEAMLWDRAHGKTVERVELKERVEGLEDLTPDMVAQKLERVQRMLTLLKNARADDDQKMDDEHVRTPTAVH